MWSNLTLTIILLLFTSIAQMCNIGILFRAMTRWSVSIVYILCMSLCQMSLTYCLYVSCIVLDQTPKLCTHCLPVTAAVSIKEMSWVKGWLVVVSFIIVSGGALKAPDLNMDFSAHIQHLTVLMLKQIQYFYTEFKITTVRNVSILCTRIWYFNI